MNADADLVIIVGQHGDRPVLRLRGELDASGRERLCSAISTALERRPPVLMLDVSGLEFTDCGGLTVLFWAHQRLAERGHQLIITGATPMVRRLLYLTGLDGYLHLSSPGPELGSPDPGLGSPDPGLGTPELISPPPHRSPPSRPPSSPGPAASAAGSAHADSEPL